MGIAQASIISRFLAAHGCCHADTICSVLALPIHRLPRLLSPTPKVVEVAERLLGHWCDLGHERHDIEDGATPILHRARSLVVARVCRS